MHDFYDDEEEMEALENPVIMGYEVTPLQLGIGLAAIGAVAYYFYSQSGTAVPEEGGIAAISMADGASVDAESVPADEVAVEVVVPELTKAEWLKKVKALKAFKDFAKASTPLKGVCDFAKVKVDKVSLVTKAATFMAPGGKTYTPVAAQVEADQLLTLCAPFTKAGADRMKADGVSQAEIRKGCCMYALARPDMSIEFLGAALMKVLPKVNKKTVFVPVALSSVATKEELTDELKQEVAGLLKKAAAKAPKDSALGTAKKLHGLSSLRVAGVSSVPADTALAVQVKTKSGSQRGAKVFPAGTRLVRVQWAGAKVGGKPAPVQTYALSEEGKVTFVELLQPVQG